jgi:hypothetical protein
MRLEPFEPDGAPPGAAWLEIVRRPTETAFVSAFTSDAILDASVLAQPAVGAVAIHRVFEATKSLYEAISFTQEDVVGERTYLHWQGWFEGRPVSGVTVLTCASQGLIASITLYHRPLAQVVAFAHALVRQLDAA